MKTRNSPFFPIICSPNDVAELQVILVSKMGHCERGAEFIFGKSSFPGTRSLASPVALQPSSCQSSSVGPPSSSAPGQPCLLATPGSAALPSSSAAVSAASLCTAAPCAPAVGE